MNRLGFNCSNSNLNQILSISKSPYLFLEGIYSHFASAGEGKKGKNFTHLQAKRFLSMIDKLKDNGVNFNIRHISNSAGILDYPEYHLDMVRPGIILYGLYPSNKIKNSIPLKQVMSVYSKIAQVKNVSKNKPVSYGGEFVTKKRSRLAVVPVGYADGLSRKSRNYNFLVNDKRAKIVGRICMDQTIIDASGIDVKLGDVVTIVGSVPYCSVDFLAKLNDTINYEITCAISKRVPRIFIE
jgi:alanine racemase